MNFVEEITRENIALMEELEVVLAGGNCGLGCLDDQAAEHFSR